MAKKGQAIQLQQEINTDEDFEKLLLKDGLIVVDVYAEWCGPCLGMQATLKKVKLEFGGDLLTLAIAKSDEIAVLERFKGKSEPTWMFISHSKMVNIMFGADAPKLSRLIIEELKKEELAKEDKDTGRLDLEVWQLAPEEQEQFDAAAEVARLAAEKEAQKKAQEFLDRKTAECKNVLEFLPGFGMMFIFPHARDNYRSVMNEFMEEAGLLMDRVEKIKITPEIVSEMAFFDPEVIEDFPEWMIEQITEHETLAIMLKSRAYDPECGITTDERVLEMVYGEMKGPPGSPGSPAQTLMEPEKEEEEAAEAKEEAEETKEEPETKSESASGGSKEEEKPRRMVGVWVPKTPFVRATCLRMFFPMVRAEYTLPEPDPTPDHYAIVFDLSKKDELMKMIEDDPSSVMRYGFFTSGVAEEAKLVAKTAHTYEASDKKTGTEKIVLQVSKLKSECTFALAQMGPLYMSPNATEGQEECQLFFPENYDEIEEKVVVTTEPATEEAVVEETEHEEEDDDVGDEEEGDVGDEGDVEEGDVMVPDMDGELPEPEPTGDVAIGEIGDGMPAEDPPTEVPVEDVGEEGM